MLGFMGVLGYSFNFMNIFVGLMLVGIALSCLASITLLPALLATGKFRHRKAAMLGEPEPEDE